MVPSKGIDCKKKPMKSHKADRGAVIVSCGTIQQTVVTDIALCPPAGKLCVDDIEKDGFIDPETDVVICVDKVLARGVIRKQIPYFDVEGCPRLRLACIPVEACIEIPGVKPDDKVGFASIEVECEFDEVRKDGSLLHEVMCVKFDVAIEREFCGEPVCNED